MIVIGALTAGLGVALLLLTLLFYQSTSKSVLAQQTFIGRMQGVLGFVRIADRVTNPLYRGSKPPAPLPHYDLTLDPVELAAIEQSLPQDDVYLSEDAKIWAKGTLASDGTSSDVKARVRGDRYNHWRFRKKSWRLSFPDDRLFRGVKELNLIIPEDRVWFVEPLSAYRADKFGLFHPPMRFVTASINGSAPMLYLEIEHWTKEMLEKQARPGDVNLYKTGDIATSSFNPGWDPIEEDIAYWDKYQAAAVPPHDSYEEVDLLFRLSRAGAHRDPDFTKQIDLTFDHEKLVRWYALSLLAGNLHIAGDNLRFFWDISRGRYEPIVWDISSTTPRSLLSLPGNGLWNEVFSVPEWRLEAHRFLWEYLNDGASVEDDLTKARELRAMIERAAYRDSMKLQSNRQVQNDLDRAMGQVRANVVFLKDDLARSELLINRRLPNTADRARGIALTLDCTSRGSVASVLAGFRGPLPAGARLFRDDGDGVWDAEDPSVPLVREGAVWKTGDAAHTLLWPDNPPVDDNGTATGAPHTRHRFFVVAPGGSIDHRSLVLDLRNAVTGEPSQVLGDVLLDTAALE